jgi:hypothetical protein
LDTRPLKSAGYLKLPAEGAVVEVFKLYDRVKLVLHLNKNFDNNLKINTCIYTYI